MKGFFIFRVLFFLGTALMLPVQGAFAESPPPVFAPPSQAELRAFEVQNQVNEIRASYGAGQVPQAVEAQLQQTENAISQVNGLAGQARVLSNSGLPQEQIDAFSAQTQRAISDLERNFASAVDTANANPSPEIPQDAQVPEPVRENTPEAPPSSGTEQNEDSSSADVPAENGDETKPGLGEPQDTTEPFDPFAPDNDDDSQAGDPFGPSAGGTGTSGGAGGIGGAGAGANGGNGGGLGAGNGGIAQNEKDKVLRWGVCRLYASVEGGMGGLFATIAGVLAIIFSVVGAFKAAWGFLLVAVGSFILRSLVSLFYGGSDFGVCEPLGGGRAPVPAVVSNNAPYEEELP